MEAKEVIEIAKKNVSNESSMLCLSDAMSCYEKGEYAYAKSRALKSLAHSIGVFHPDYVKSAA